ncbi:hypothetical protein CFN78_21205 [Amycolatopsis antarctica]|uniref:Uncharacterized protein n=1 Tax=Amycolatopsis antarctica TaxID=1854586 RepID=A0A263CZB8_9PSEU|nr:hypothetical protein [Amycolatopsis antarctica]OZM71309.1 hypothetical protein CFN78_21205 [Amycolatopsis antarctica]
MEQRNVDVRPGLLADTGRLRVTQTGVHRAGDLAVCSVVVYRYGEESALPPETVQATMLPRVVRLRWPGAGASTRRSVDLRRRSLGGDRDLVIATYAGPWAEQLGSAVLEVVDFWLNPSV